MLVKYIEIITDIHKQSMSYNMSFV